MRLCRLGKHDGCRDTEAIEAFIVCLEAYRRSHSGTEESKVIVASCVLEGEARQR